MKLLKSFLVGAVVLVVIFSSGCLDSTERETLLKLYPIESMDDVITHTEVTLDKQVTSDGNGSLRITASEFTTIHLYETGDIDIEDTRLIYRAQLRTERLDGKSYLEMWCQFKDKGEFFSRDLASPISGTTDWSTEETLFFLKKGENPDNVRLNVVIEGKGTIWIDDIRLLKKPL